MHCICLLLTQSGHSLLQRNRTQRLSLSEYVAVVELSLIILLAPSYKFDSGSDGEAICHFCCLILEELET